MNIFYMYFLLFMILINTITARYVNEQNLKEENIKLIKQLLGNLQSPSIQNPNEDLYDDYITGTPKSTIEYSGDKERSKEIKKLDDDSHIGLKVHILEENFDSGSGETNYVNLDNIKNSGNKYQNSVFNNDDDFKIFKFKEKFDIGNENTHVNYKKLADYQDYYDNNNEDLYGTKNKEYEYDGKENIWGGKGSKDDQYKVKKSEESFDSVTGKSNYFNKYQYDGNKNQYLESEKGYNGNDFAKILNFKTRFHIPNENAHLNYNNFASYHDSNKYQNQHVNDQYSQKFDSSSEGLYDTEKQNYEYYGSDNTRDHGSNSDDFAKVPIFKGNFDSDSGKKYYYNSHKYDNNENQNLEFQKNYGDNLFKTLKFKERFINPNEKVYAKYNYLDNFHDSNKYQNEDTGNGDDENLYNTNNFKQYGRQNKELNTDGNLDKSSTTDEISNTDSGDMDLLNKQRIDRDKNASEDKDDSKEKTKFEETFDEGKNKLNDEVVNVTFKNDNEGENDTVEYDNYSKLIKEETNYVELNNNNDQINKTEKVHLGDKKNHPDNIGEISKFMNNVKNGAEEIGNKNNNKGECNRANIFLEFLNDFINRYKNKNCKEDSDKNKIKNDAVECNQGLSINFKLRCKRDNCEISLNNMMKRETNYQSTTYEKDNNRIKDNLEQALYYLKQGLLEYYGKTRYNSNCDRADCDKYYDINCRGNNCKYEIIVDNAGYNKIKSNKNGLFKLRCRGDRCELDSEDDILETYKKSYEFHENYIKGNDILNQFIKDRHKTDRSDASESLEVTHSRYPTKKSPATEDKNVNVLYNVIHELRLALVNNRPKKYRLFCIGSNCEVESNDLAFVQQVQNYLQTINTKQYLRTYAKIEKSHVKRHGFTDQTRSSSTYRKDDDGYDDYTINFDDIEGVNKLAIILNDFQNAIVSNMEPNCRGHYCSTNKGITKHQYQLICNGANCEVESDDANFLRHVKLHNSGINYQDYTRVRSTDDIKRNKKNKKNASKVMAYHLEAFFTLTREALAHKVIDYIKNRNINNINDLNLEKIIVDRLRAIKNKYQASRIEDSELHEIVMTELNDINEYEVKTNKKDNAIYVPGDVYKNLMKLSTAETVKKNHHHKFG